MNAMERNDLYDRLCRALTDYENSENTEEVNRGFLDEFYFLLVEIQNRCEDLMSDED